MKTTLIALLCVASSLMSVAVSATPPVGTPAAGIGETAKRLKSQSNLTKLGLAVTMYVLDHHGALPDDARWTEELRPYLESKAVFHDPAAPAAQKWCYAYNRNLSHKLLSSLQSPPTTVLFFETTKNANQILRYSVHKSALVDEEISALAAADVHLFYLPSYSPELSEIEPICPRSSRYGRRSSITRCRGAVFRRSVI